jgi:predicted RecB family nuclease
MRLIASDFYTYYRPSECELRVYLRHKGINEASPGPYEEVIRRLGERHEKAHLASFPVYVDLSSGSIQERLRRTHEEVNRGAPVIYQGALSARVLIKREKCEIVGEPDFLINMKGQYLIRDSKISKRITEEDHPEILRQMELYGWLFEQMFRRPSLSLEVHSGTSALVPVLYDGGTTALNLLESILALKEAEEEPYSPVGWTKCGHCGFRPYCWPRAEANRDVALLPGVDQGLAIAFHKQGIYTIDQLLDKFDERRLSDLKRPWGDKQQRVGKKAESILLTARAMATEQEIQLRNPDVPNFPNYVMFDLEGLPPQLDELEKIYLWGLQVFGKKPSAFLPAVAGFGDSGDHDGWAGFLHNAAWILSQYGDIPFVHWHHYERSRLDMYVKRYGDPDGIAARVRQNLLDLLPITQGSIALPLPSYSLKVVEQYIGFKRTMDEFGGDWAMAKYIEATETEDEKTRAEVMDQILTYNCEDLQATWAVLQWLKTKRG